ncbi:MAG: FHA domain-containing protein, partial [Anaerolineae bacterium]|nr:FHA domain-containing protein [Anaerolineae bacterium]
MTVYGRLDIYWPDGNFDSYVLEQPTVTVGRAEGSTIALDTESLSRYHFSIRRDERKVITITDLGSANGTFIDGVPLPPNQPRVLEAVEEIQAGQLRIIFQPGDDAPTMPTPALPEETARVERPDCRLEVDTTTLDVWPASSSSAELALTNLTTEPAQYRLLLTGMPDKWVRVTRPELEVFPGETAQILVHVKPPRHPDVLPATFTLVVHVARVDKPDSVLEVPLTVHIRGYGGLGIALGTRHPEAGDVLRLYLHNQGNQPLPVRITGSDPAGALLFNLPSAPLTLAAGQRLQVTGTIQPRQRALVGAAREYEFHLRAQAQTAAAYLAVVGGRVSVKARLPVWGALSLAGIALSLLILALLFATGLVNAPPPVIQGLALSADRVARGQPLLVTWQAQHATSLALYVNDGPVSPPPAPQDTQYSIPTDNLAGEVTIELVAQNRTGDAVQYASAIIYEPMRIASFQAAPDSLMRHTVSSITLTWSVPGAASVALTGLDNTDFARSPELRDRYAAEGSLQLNGIATAPLTLTLTGTA